MAQKILVVRHARNVKRIDVGIATESKWLGLRGHDLTASVATMTVKEHPLVGFEIVYKTYYTAC